MNQDSLNVLANIIPYNLDVMRLEGSIFMVCLITQTPDEFQLVIQNCAGLVWDINQRCLQVGLNEVERFDNVVWWRVSGRFNLEWTASEFKLSENGLTVCGNP